MMHMSLVAFLLTLPMLVQAPAPVAVSLPDDPCVTARQIAAQGPCLRPEDCGAFHQWTELYGPPRTTPLDPRLSAQGGGGKAVPQGAAPQGIVRVPNPAARFPTCRAEPAPGRR